jgi:hypothetical protein
MREEEERDEESEFEVAETGSVNATQLPNWACG